MRKLVCALLLGVTPVAWGATVEVGPLRAADDSDALLGEDPGPPARVCGTDSRASRRAA